MKTLESPLDCKIEPVNLKGNQPWILIGRTGAEAPILWPPDTKSQLIRKDPDAGKDWRQEKGMTEDEMVRWHHWLNARESEQTLGEGEGQRSLGCCSPWGRKESDMTKWTTVDPQNWDQLSPGTPKLLRWLSTQCPTADNSSPWPHPSGCQVCLFVIFNFSCASFWPKITETSDIVGSVWL